MIIIYEIEIMGYPIPVVSDAYYAYHLLLHMLQHFLRAGFGLKLPRLGRILEQGDRCKGERIVHTTYKRKWVIWICFDDHES